MLKNSKIVAALVLAGGIVAAASGAEAVQITSPSTTVTGYGVYHNNPGLIVDGTLAGEAGIWQSAQTVWWEAATADERASIFFVLDLGQVYTIEDALISVDNNDYYKAYYSLDNSTWTELFWVWKEYGEISWGMDTMSTVYGDPEYIPEINFSPVDARYIKFRATSGDQKFSISELELYGQLASVPEPATALLLGSGFLATAAFRKKLSKR